MQWKSYTDNSKTTAEAYLGSLEKGREPSSVFCIERVALVSFAPGGNQKAKIISHPKGIVCICNHLEEPPSEEINCIKAKSVSLFLGDMLHFQTDFGCLLLFGWWDLEVLCRQLSQGFAIYWQENSKICSLTKKILYLDLHFQVANPDIVFWMFIYLPNKSWRRHRLCNVLRTKHHKQS